MASSMDGVDGINCIALVKDTERYIFLYDDHNDTGIALLNTMGRFASNSELSFSWYDAAVLSTRFRKAREARAVEER